MDPWAEVGRTVGGVPVGDDQIKMIVDQINQKLDLKPDDLLLDLGCGNGALGSLLDCGYHGVDRDVSLILKANRSRHNHACYDVLEFVQTGGNKFQPKGFDKCLSYGAFMYFDDQDKILDGLYDMGIERAFIGNYPDKDRASNFLYPGLSIDDTIGSLGFWRTMDEFRQIAGRWKCEFSTMPANFYASHYRYDILLTR